MSDTWNNLPEEDDVPISEETFREWGLAQSQLFEGYQPGQARPR